MFAEGFHCHEILVVSVWKIVIIGLVTFPGERMEDFVMDLINLKRIYSGQTPPDRFQTKNGSRWENISGDRELRSETFCV